MRTVMCGVVKRRLKMMAKRDYGAVCRCEDGEQHKEGGKGRQKMMAPRDHGAVDVRMKCHARSMRGHGWTSAEKGCSAIQPRDNVDATAT
jgi:hypothetical protein